MSADSGPGNREVAYRLFAAEFEDSTVSYSESDEERAPNYVITPTGGRVNRLFLAGVLTETERVGGEQLRGRVVDPTGAFVAYAGQYQPDELAFLDRVEPPAFLAVTGKARTFSPEDSDRVYTSVRPESISEVDAETRDRWVVRTAEQTLDRVATMASALRSDLRGDALRERLVEEGVGAGLASGVALSIEHYGTTSAYLQALRSTAIDAVRVVAGERDEVDRLDLAPDEGGTDDAVLAGLADVDLDVTTPSPGVAADDPAATGDADAEPSETATPTGSAGTDTGATDADAGSASEPEPESETETGTRSPERTGEPDEAATEPPETAAEREPDPERGTPSATASAESGTETGTGGAGSDSPSVGTDTEDVETDTEPTTAADAEPVDTPETDKPPSEPDDEGFEDFEPGEFELPEEEREEIEAEFGTDFETAGEVGPAGEADIETPEPEPVSNEPPTAASGSDAEPATEPGSSEPASAAGTAEGTPAEGTTATDDEPEPETGTADAGEEADADPDAEADTEADADVDIDEATVEVIGELDDGDGASREAVVETVADRHGVDPDAVSEAIEDAMMSGRAYEPSDGRLKAI